jgi:high-affinity nickel-transport protein
MIEIAGVMSLGFVLGLRHATDADHVVAVTTIVAQEPSVRSAARIGGLWGIGHTASLLAFGGVLIGFQLVLPARLGLSLEMLVAIMLIGLGAWNVRSGVLLSGATHAPPAPARPTAASVRRPLLIGSVHGLAGSAAIALLVLSTISSPWWAGVYLLVFGAGTIAGMMLVTTMLATPTLWFGVRAGRWDRGLRVIAGLASLAFGVLLARDLVVDGGLFSAVPSWDPH